MLLQLLLPVDNVLLVYQGHDGHFSKLGSDNLHKFMIGMRVNEFIHMI